MLTKGGALKEPLDFISKLKIPVYSSKEFFVQSNTDYNKGIAFCGVGDPTFFWKTLNNLSINVACKSRKYYNTSPISAASVSVNPVVNTTSKFKIYFVNYNGILFCYRTLVVCSSTQPH